MIITLLTGQHIEASAAYDFGYGLSCRYCGRVVVLDSSSRCGPCLADRNAYYREDVLREVEEDRYETKRRRDTE